MRFAFDPKPVENNPENVFNILHEGGFHFSKSDPGAFIKFDFRSPKTVIGNSIFYTVVKGVRAYITSYKMSYSPLGDLYDETPNYWVNPDTGSTIFPGIKTPQQQSAFVLFQAQSARTVKFEPLAFVHAMAFRMLFLFCSGK